MNFLDNVKARIGLTDDKQDIQLQHIIDNVKAELMAMLPDEIEGIPQKIAFIVVEVTIKRYNRVGAEGMTSESQDGKSNTYESNDFDQYKPLLNNLFYKDQHKGKVVFY
ncbi:phage head-tail connector protein [Staphylococcus simiae]|uniref:phage head-tail connector protein n=1 Tax=Staphylococcus simiae TaxID=308354 RepID=UPI001A9765B4|nr:phage head-tail connector protein [Staphylococcus simiae]MBO1199114.1 phage head-tail connector protein [Staphylococcus simiae]MBO1201178.1 phage head-tail connector protein [Staphylococcus simiae]MBO1203326.1 phage head-tail connector protein [Staphylococcus simiae]MBO1210854.1 phage head-tail connector protein [Staphylococcus simiae]MBO1229552.1 phage head-tail connector protein [Staphylococcus simiae]